MAAQLRSLFGPFTIAIAARLAQLVMGIFLARYLGPAEYGIFTFALAAAIIIGNVGAMGWPSVLVRYLPEYLSRSQEASAAGLKRLAFAATLFGAATLAASVLLVVQIAPISEEMQAGISLACLISITISLRLFLRNYFSSTGKPAAGIFYDELIVPMCMAITLPLLSAQSATDAVIIYTFLGILAAIIAATHNGLTLRSNKTALTQKPIKPKYQLAEWTRVSMGLGLGSVSRLIMSRLDVIMLASLATMESVGLYSAAFRITFALTFPQVVISTVFTPIIRRSIVERNYINLSRTLKANILFAMVTTALISTPIILAPEKIILLLFGNQYRGSEAILIVLTLMQGANAIIVPLTSFLTMADRHREIGLVTLLLLAIVASLNLLLIPIYGASGAAASGLTGSILLLIASALMARSQFARITQQI